MIGYIRWVTIGRPLATVEIQSTWTLKAFHPYTLEELGGTLPSPPTGWHWCEIVSESGSKWALFADDPDRVVVKLNESGGEK